MLLTVKDVAQKLNVSQSCIYQLVESGRIPHHRIGLGRGAIRFNEADITEYLMSNREESSDKQATRITRTRRLKHIKL
ncbi:MAG: helix-turn-helix domain-containing protein [Rhodopirellula sp.]|nr:helix-turn-helix domain-containing protein [Rhodopirellula sp.]